MALAILDFVSLGDTSAIFTIDTGTNSVYQLKIGRSFQDRNGIDWIDDVTYSTALARNENGGSLFRSTKEVELPAARFSDGARYVQLFTFKSADHRSPAFSSVVEIPGRMALPGTMPVRRSYRAPMSLSTTFEPARRIPCRTAAMARSMSIEDVLASVVKLAMPLVEGLLKGEPADAHARAGKKNGGDALANALATLLRSILGDAEGVTVAGAKSLSVSGTNNDNRFRNGAYAHPFMFGIDDALLGALAGPILQLVPQLMNAANQRKIQMKQADNQLVAGILSDINRRLLLQQLANAKPATPKAAPELANLIELLQQVPASDAIASESALAPAAAQGFSVPEEASGAVLSSRAVVGFMLADALPWNGLVKPLFARGNALSLRVQLNVVGTVPKSALPKAILRIVFKDAADHSALLEKTFKLKGVMANTPLSLDFAAAELVPLAANKPVEVLAEMRWLTTANVEYKAFGSSEIVLVEKYALKQQGSAAATTETELTDMTRFRPFWNKLWEAPVLDGAGTASGDGAKYLWELQANLKYSVLLAPDHESNGLMETKFLKGPEDPESLSMRTEGRMKGGIELSLAELNKLLALWTGQAPLEPAKLEALKTADFAKANSGELITSMKLGGKAGERGMIWAVPVFRLTALTLSSISKTDESGQVTALADEQVQFPLPASVRIIGLKSRR